MALNDVTIYDEGAFGYPGDIEFAVAASATTIKAGEPTLKLLGASGTVVAPLTTNFPTCVAAQLTAGIASSTSTNTAAAAGTVRVTKPVPGITYLCAPLTAASWDKLFRNIVPLTV